MLWVLLIYSVPSQPARKRAAVWRELKRIQGIQLRNGVYALPDGEASRRALDSVADLVRTQGGQATVIESARLDEATSKTLLRQGQDARAQEYAAVASEARTFINHLEAESAQRAFTGSELVGFGSDLDKLHRWFAQACLRDVFGSDGSVEATHLLAACAAALAQARMLSLPEPSGVA